MKAKVSADSVRTKLRVIARAQKDAADELPETTATTIGTTESSIIEHCQDLLANAENDARNEIKTIGARFSATSVDHGRLTNARVDLTNAVEAAFSTRRFEISEAATRIQRARREYLHFRRKHNREYEAEYPQAMLLFIGIIAFMVVLESAANAMFFAQASDTGYLGGISTAALISLVNVALGLLVGVIGFRYIAHNNHAHKVWAIPLTLAIFCGDFWFNMVVAYYRDSLSRDPTAELTEVISFNIIELFNGRTFHSLMLLIIGATIFLVSSYEGTKLLGSYPGYSRRHRKLTEAEVAMSNLKDDLRDDLQDALDSHSEPLKSLIVEAQSVRARQLQAKSELTGVISHVGSLQNSIQEVCRQLVNDYRAENRSIRQTPAPRYFSETPTLRHADLNADVAALLRHADEVAKSCEEVGVKAEDNLRYFQDLIVKRLENIDDFARAAEIEGQAKADAESAALQG
ncbi:hypothetical protein GCM10010520_23330 [Rhizobium viscosum]|uniref:Uncharacterized protein n=1 Tax=Rhizobium viscosum TaxID=1673 RepID=A0ABR9IIU9_RHIVS|nr:hypothetical protein [Rhizobium viscosum]MBE1503104.1 hypothetical protein [Rhizobium viscosum]